MIEYDYTIKRDETDEIVTYKPGKIPKKLPNLVYIEGPNSSGKSTLLHLLALSFFARQNKRIKESLQEKVRNLIDPTLNHLRFNIKITDKDGNTILSAEKRDFQNEDILLRDSNNKIIAQSQFESKYNLIYDIPENPTKRIKELTQEIIMMQGWFSQRLILLRNELRGIIKDIRDAKDPNKIKTLTKEIAEKNKLKQTNERKVKNLSEELKNIKLFTYLKLNNFYEEKAKLKEEGLKGIKITTTTTTKKRKKVTKELSTLTDKVADKVNAIVNLYAEVTPTIRDFFKNKSEKHRVSIWEDLRIHEELKDPDLKDVLKVEGAYFRNLFKDLLANDPQNESLDEAEVFRRLIDLLENYINLNITIPGVNLPIAGFVSVLKEKNKSYETLIVKRNRISKAIEDLDTIIKERRQLCTLLSEIHAAIADAQDSDEMVEEDEAERLREKKLRIELEECKLNITYYQAELIKLGIADKNLRKNYYAAVVLGKALRDLLGDYNESDLKEKIFVLEQEISTAKDNVIKFLDTLEYLTKIKSDFEMKKKHPYHAHLEFLEKTLAEVQKTEDKMQSYNKYIINIEKGKSKYSTSNKDEKEYYKRLFVYLGSRVQTVLHVDKEYKIASIDLINNTIITKNGKIIRTGDMGTGQSQSAFLTGLLNTDNDKKVIALFDEVAMMDEHSLAPVYNKLRSLSKSGKLLIGIIVQKANKTKVNPI